MISIFIKVLFTAFFINLLYEMVHSLLYKTCHEASLKKYVYLMLKAATFDSIAITVMYYVIYKAFLGQASASATRAPLIVFFVMSLLFAYAWEKYALQHKRWEYTEKMPIILGVGLTPLVQLFLTGLLTFYVVFNFNR